MELLLKGVVGSTAYGLNHAGSDKDYLGVYKASLDDVLSLGGAKVTDTSKVSKNPDTTLHELSKFLKLCLDCNPTVMELLWLGEYEHLTEQGQMLIDIRKSFLHTSKVRATYTGYAIQQARRLLNREAAGKKGFAADLTNRTEKHGRHCFRLLLAGQHLLETGTLLVNVSQYKDELLRAGQLASASPQAFKNLFDKKLSTFDETKSVLPDTPDKAKVNTLLVKLRSLN